MTLLPRCTQICATFYLGSGRWDTDLLIMDLELPDPNFWNSPHPKRPSAGPAALPQPTAHGAGSFLLFLLIFQKKVKLVILSYVPAAPTTSEKIGGKPLERI